MSDPKVRAGSCQTMIDSLDAYRDGLKAKVLGRVPAESVRVLQETPRSSWVSCDHDRPFVDAIVDELGYAGAVDCVRFSIGRHLGTPLLRTVVKGARHLFGGGPGALFKMIPRSWGLVYRDLAQPKLEELEPGKATFVLENVHLIVFKADGYRASFEALFLGVFDITETKGTVRVRNDPRSRTITFKLEWADPRASST